MANENNKLKGRRYSDAEKKEILDFVDKTNAERGRGGISHASKKYGVTALTIANWIKAREASEGPTIATGTSKAFRELAEDVEQLSEIDEQLRKLQAKRIALAERIARRSKELAIR